MLRDIKSMNQNIFLTVDTTCPLPRSDRPPTPRTPPRTFEPPPTIHEDNEQVVLHMNQESPSTKSRKKKRRKHRSKNR